MKQKLTVFWRDERAAASILEYSIVFPFCLFVLVFLFSVGYFLNQRAVLDAAATRAVLVAQKVYTDMNYTDLVEFGNGDKDKDYVGYKQRNKTNLRDLKTEPYRYIEDAFNGEITAEVEKQMKERAEKIVTFHQLVQLDERVTEVVVTAKVSGNIFKKAEVEIQQKFKMPVAKIFQMAGGDGTLFTMKSRAQLMIMNPSELVRNINFALDTVERLTKGTDITREFTLFFGKITNFFKGKE